MSGFARKNLLAMFLVSGLLLGCSDGNDRNVSVVPVPEAEPLAPADAASVYALVDGCYALSESSMGSYIAVSESEDVYSLADTGAASRFRLRAADLGVYLLLDEDGHYLTSDGEQLLRQASLTSDVSLQGEDIVIDDGRRSEGEWQLIAAPGGRFQLMHLRSGAYLGESSLVADESLAADFDFEAAEGCAAFPELSVDASGDVSVTEFEDGSLFGFVDTHSHLFTNFAFGGGGVFHGAPFHRLGVEHALGDCDLSHGEQGRRDIMGFAFGARGDIGIAELIPALLNGELSDDSHRTQGYPDFTDWPNAPSSATHQMQYYTWLQRAHMSGLRLLVQHVTSNEVLCQLMVGIGAQPQRYDCGDMVAADRILEETYALERYIDAQSGGPGEGWLRIVFSPAQAREQIALGKLAVVLGLEVSDLFDCVLVPLNGATPCTEEVVIERLDEYYDRGVRVLFPVHKYDNAFSAGDGDRDIIDIGNFAHSGHYSNFIECPAELLTFPGGFDQGGLSAPLLNQPRAVFDSPPPLDMSGFAQDPVGTLIGSIALFSGPASQGEYCQNHGLTELGEFLIKEMMRRGMVIEVDHFSRKSYQRAYEILAQYDYPAVGSHGRNNNGTLYGLGGVSTSSFGRCRASDETATMDNRFQQRIQLMRDQGAYVAEGFGFDLNGFAGAPGPRFGPDSNCAEPQTDEGITYPFTSYAGDVTLEQPQVGNRTLDFNNEGMVHLGLVAELIEDVRRDGVSDLELEPLFRSAEGYIQMWEKSEASAKQFEE